MSEYDSFGTDEQAVNAELSGYDASDYDTSTSYATDSVATYATQETEQSWPDQIVEAVEEYFDPDADSGVVDHWAGSIDRKVDYIAEHTEAGEYGVVTPDRDDYDSFSGYVAAMGEEAEIVAEHVEDRHDVTVYTTYERDDEGKNMHAHTTDEHGVGQ